MVNVGIIGAGRIGQVHMNSILTRVPNAKIKAVADPFLSEAAAKKQQEHEQLPDRVAEMEDALCEQDAANEKRLTDIETALCELDAALNKE